MPPKYKTSARAAMASPNSTDNTEKSSPPLTVSSSPPPAKETEETSPPPAAARKKAAPRRKKPATETWCVCEQPDDGSTMVECADKECEIKWFHLRCIEEKEKVEDKENWTCGPCVQRQHDNRKPFFSQADVDAILPPGYAGLRGPGGDVYGLSSWQQETGPPQIVRYEYASDRKNGEKEGNEGVGGGEMEVDEEL